MEQVLNNLRTLIEELEISKSNPNSVIDIDLYYMKHNSECATGDEIFMLEVQLSEGKVAKMSPYGEVPFSGYMEAFDIEMVSPDVLSEIFEFIEKGDAEITIKN